jgi:hypothetical protein
MNEEQFVVSPSDIFESKYLKNSRWQLSIKAVDILLIVQQEATALGIV